ncbi:ATP-binding protein, partial [Streptomyces sp. 13-12-16]
AGAPDVRPGSRPEPAHPLLTASDPDDHPPVRAPGAAPAPPAGRTVRARSSAPPPI